MSHADGLLNPILEQVLYSAWLVHVRVIFISLIPDTSPSILIVFQSLVFKVHCVSVTLAISISIYQDIDKYKWRHLKEAHSPPLHVLQGRLLHFFLAMGNCVLTAWCVTCSLQITRTATVFEWQHMIYSWCSVNICWLCNLSCIIQHTA